MEREKKSGEKGKEKIYKKKEKEEEGKRKG